MNIQPLDLPGVYVIEPTIAEDHRGFFVESYNKGVMHSLGIKDEFIQDNQSLSLSAGTIRGLHFQVGSYSQTKLVRVLSGAIYDVVVDIREGSPTFGKWTGVTLSEANRRQLYVPKGFAHGICTLVDRTQILYKVDQYYSSNHDRGIVWNDPHLGIDWPVSYPILSDKDSQLPTLKESEMKYNL